MLEDVLLITEKHTTAANIIIKEILKKKKDKYVVAISGESGSDFINLLNLGNLSLQYLNSL